MNKFRTRCLYLAATILAITFAGAAGAATLTVTNNADSGPGSLRAVVTSANNGDTITFAPSLNGQTITLTSGELLIDKNLIIIGPGANLLTISGNNASRVFETSAPLEIHGLTIANASVDQGAGINVTAPVLLTVANCILTNNSASDLGGAIRTEGSVAISSTTFSANHATNHGGGIYVEDVDGCYALGQCTAVISENTFNGNSAGQGGAIYQASAFNDSGAGDEITNTIFNCTFVSNTANSFSGGAYFGYDGAATRFVNCTFSGNQGNSIDNDPEGHGSDYELFNNIFVSTVGSGIGGGVSAGAVVGSGNVCDENSCKSYGGTKVTTAQINLLSLGNNGGPTQTMMPGTGSVAIGAGNLSRAVDQNGQPLVFDQRGAPRVVNNLVDIGAVQSNGVVPFQGLVVTSEQDTDNPPQVTLRDALTYAAFLGGSEIVTFNNGSVPGAATNFYDGAQHTITLNGAELLIPGGNVTVQGPGANALTVSGNSASRVFNIGSSSAVVTIGGLTISSGNVSDSGGGILNSGTLTVTKSTLSGNNASNDGGGIFNYLSALTVTDSTLSGNSGGVGGGIYNYNGTVSVLNSTLAGNSTDYAGGAIISNFGTVSVINSTVCYNGAGAYAGGLNSGSGTLIVANTIVAGNTGGYLGGPDVYGPVTSQGYNLIGNTANSSGFGATGDILNPAGGAMLSSLGNYGGTAQTIVPLPGSPAINAGNVPSTSGQGVSAGSGVTVTPTNMSFIVPNTILGINIGQADAEYVQVQSVTATTFTANFSKAHGPGFTIVLGTDQRGFIRPVKGLNDIGAVELDIPGPITDSNPASNTVVENAPAGTIVGLTASAIDPDNETITYSLIADTSNGGFTINANTGVVTVLDGSKIKYAATAGHSYTVTVQAANAEATASQAFKIAVTQATHLGTASGSGTISSQASRPSFSFSISNNNNNGTPSGTLSYTDTHKGIKLTSTAITSISLINNQATFSGKGTIPNNNPHKLPTQVTFTVTATDNGVGPRDTFTIQIGSPYYATGNLSSGNIVVH